jgi:hypothetical protein
MALSQVAISVCNDGNVAQLDVADQVPGGVYYRIEVYRASQPSGGFGVTLSGSRAEHICGLDHLKPRSNQVFRYTFSVGDTNTHKSDLPTLLEGREEFNPKGMPEGSWEVRIRDLDAGSPTYGSIIHAVAAPAGQPRAYDIRYGLRLADPKINRVPVRSPLPQRLFELNPLLADLSTDLDQLAPAVEFVNNALARKSSPTRVLSLKGSDKT